MSSKNWFSALKWRQRVRRSQHELSRRRVTPRAHGLDAPLVVSLTSFPKRFETLPLTLKCLLQQSVKADAGILWVAHADMDALTPEILQLQEQGLSIRACDELRPYNKLIHALVDDPDRYIATADDDVYYEADWLEKLVTGAQQHSRHVISHRSHRVGYDANGQMLPYGQWQKNIGTAGAGVDVFATGVSGVLYPPRCLHSQVTDAETFTRLCPGTDDIWFYWMARMAGTQVHHLGPKRRILEWPSSQDVSLRQNNHGQDNDNGNDRAIAELIRHFGQPK
jgi:hypothetical protein